MQIGEFLHFPGAIWNFALLVLVPLHAFAEDFGIYIPEINDPHETPFYDRPEIVVGEITAIEPSTYQTILERA